MRLILSRKGFDSGAGGCPSPIFPDGSLVSLPIPDPDSPVRYCDITWRGRNLGDVVESLTRGRKRRDFRAHLDPDVRREDLPRLPGWRPSLGQVGASQSHLAKQGVAAGDLFLFFGLFRPVHDDLRWAGPPEQRVWGWMQVGEIVSVDEDVRAGGRRWAWAGHHPHLHRETDSGNTLYVATERLDLPGVRGVPAAGAFERAEDRHRLTARGESPSMWRLPRAFLPRGRTAPTYHAKSARWRDEGETVLLRSASRGQEFVLELDDYPDVLAWAASVLRPSR